MALPTRRRLRKFTAIATVVRSRTVVASPDDVWSVLARFDRIAEWAPSVGHSEAMTEPPVGVGSARRVQVGRLTLVETIVEWASEQAVAYTLEGLPPFVAEATNRWTLEPAGPERTTVTLTAEITPGPKPPMRLAVAVLGRVIARGNDQLLDGMAAAVTVTTEGHPR